MKCPLCCHFVSTEDHLQDHYLTQCSGLADSDPEEQMDVMKKKFQFVSQSCPDKEVYLLTTCFDTPQIALTR